MLIGFFNVFVVKKTFRTRFVLSVPSFDVFFNGTVTDSGTAFKCKQQIFKNESKLNYSYVSVGKLIWRP